MEREPGHYWVKIMDQITVGYYHKAKIWFVMNNDDDLIESDFQWIDKPENRLPEPNDID